MCQENQEKSETNEDLKYKTYLEERKLLINAKIEGSRLFDKAILTLAAGSFGLSLAFIKQIFPSFVSYKLILIFSWISFGISILSTLISFLASQEGCSKQIEILEEDYFFTDNNRRVNINRPAIWTSRLNWLSIISFIIGVIFLASFAIINMQKDIGGKPAMSNSKDKFNEGFVPQGTPIKPGKLPDAGYVPPKTPIKPPIKPTKDGK